MKRFFVIALVILSVFHFGVSASEMSDDSWIIDGTLDNLKWTINADTGVLIIIGEGSMNTSEYVIPWKEYRNLIKAVVVSEGITDVGNYAFSYCSNLQTVELPSTLTGIGRQAFAYSSVVNINIPDSVRAIATDAFAESKLREITVPGNVREISEGAFRSCTNLETVILSEGVESIGCYAFSYTSLKTIYIPKSLMTIDINAFGDVFDLANIENVIILSETIAKDLSNQSRLIWSANNILLEKTIATSSTYVRVNFPYTRIVCVYGKTFTAYNKEQRADEHQLDNRYITSEDSHWKSCEICGINVDIVQHGFEDNCDTTCNTCGYARTTTHTYDRGSVTTPPTCKNEGVNTYACTICGATKTETIAKLTTHSYDNSCDTSCNVCGGTRTITHNYKTTWEKDSNKHWHACSVCGTEGTKLSHEYDNACDTTCNICGSTRSITHSYKTTWEKNGTQHWHVCSVCGASDTKSNHVYDNACDTSCNTCGYTRTVTHSYKTTWESGKDGHWHECSVCGESDAKKSHTPGAAATESTAQTCTTCGHVIKAALGHTHSFENKWTTNSSKHWQACGCGAKKDETSHVYDNACDTTCNTCGYTRTTSHTYDNGTVTKEPTVSAEGVKTFTCTVCGKTKTEAIPKLDAPVSDTSTPETSTSDEITTDVSETEPPTSDVPSTDVSETEPPVSDVPSTDVSETEPSVTTPEVTDVPETTTTDKPDDKNNVTVIIIIAAATVVAAGAVTAVIVIKKKK